MELKHGVAGLALAVLIFAGVYYSNDPVNLTVNEGGTVIENIGASSGPEHFGLESFYAGHVDGGLLKSTTTSASATMLATDILTREGYVRYWSMDVTDASSVTFPASTTLAHFIPVPGMCWTAKWENLGDSNLTMIEGAGFDMQEPDGQNVVIGANNFATVEYCRQLNTDIVVTVDETIPG